jgi:hypothetical protein
VPTYDEAPTPPAHSNGTAAEDGSDHDDHLGASEPVTETSSGEPTDTAEPVTAAKSDSGS